MSDCLGLCKEEDPEATPMLVGKITKSTGTICMGLGEGRERANTSCSPLDSAGSLELGNGQNSCFQSSFYEEQNHVQK